MPSASLICRADWGYGMRRERLLGPAALIVALAAAGCGGAGQDVFGGYGNVLGTVIDSGSQLPVASATVTVGGLETTTDADGRFSLVNVPTGDQQYSVAATGYRSDTGNAIRISPSVSVSLDVALTAQTEGTGAVHGLVTDASDGNGLAGVTVTAGSISGATNSSGEYTLENVPVGELSITFEKPGFASESTALTVVENATHEVQAELSEISVGAVAGTAVDSRSGLGIEGVAVFVEDHAASTLTDIEGAYLLSDVPVGTHSISYHRTGYQSETFAVTVVAGGTTSQDVSLVAPAAGALVGTVYDSASSLTVPGVAVSILGLGRHTTSGESGAYSFADVPAGAYELAVGATGYAAFTSPTLAVQAGITLSYDPLLTPLLGRIEGFVAKLEAGGVTSPAPGATVRLGPDRTTTAADDGTYAFGDVPVPADGAGYVVYASATGLEPGSVTVTPAAGRVVVAPTIVLTPL